MTDEEKEKYRGGLINKGSSYMQFDSTAITMYTGTITDNQKRTRFDYNGTHFYRDGYYVGKIGTNTMKDNDSQRGLVFDIEYNTAYMSWSKMLENNKAMQTLVSGEAGETVEKDM